MSAPLPAARPVLLRNGTVWEGGSAPPRVHTDLLVEAGRVTAIAPVSARRPPEDADVVDLDGRHVVPGLIDMHVHLVWSGEPDPAAAVARQGEQLTTLRAAANGLAQLRAGVTTVRDLGGNWDVPITVGRAVDAGVVPGPRIVAAGQTVIMTGGHDPFWGIASDGVNAVVRAVRRQVSLGAGVIKVAATGGVYGRPDGEEIGQTELSEEELAAAAHEAHRFGLRVAAHALGAEGIRHAVRAGIDTIEHGTFLTEEIVALMRERGTALCPTLAIYRTIADGRGGSIPPYATEKARTAVAAHAESLAMARAAGIPIVAGTDAGSCATPHPALVEELAAMCDLGMSATEALHAATSTAADVLGVGAERGRIAEGAVADLLVLDRNPHEDVRSLLDVHVVVKGGAVVSVGSG